MNEHGLVVGMNAVSELDTGYDPKKKTVSSLQIIRILLNYAKSVEEAVSFISDYNINPSGGPPMHYLISDTTGKYFKVVLLKI